MDRKFKVGDKVRITGNISGHYFNVNEIVTVDHVGEHSYRAVNSLDETWYIMDDEAELVEASKPRKFKVGDKVRMLEGDHNCGYKAGDILTISYSEDGTLSTGDGPRPGYIFQDSECELVESSTPDSTYSKDSYLPKLGDNVMVALPDALEGDLAEVLHITDQGCLVSIASTGKHEFMAWENVYTRVNLGDKS